MMRHRFACQAAAGKARCGSVHRSLTVAAAAACSGWRKEMMPWARPSWATRSSGPSVVLQKQMNFGWFAWWAGPK
jgi:hypothetical protein